MISSEKLTVLEKGECLDDNTLSVVYHYRRFAANYAKIIDRYSYQKIGLYFGKTLRKLKTLLFYFGEILKIHFVL